jgi:pimeloyl-ACP methyl ester carboxylesterase
MARLTGGSARVDLGNGYAVIAPGLRGQADRHVDAAADTRAIGDPTPELNASLSRAGMTPVTTIDLAVTQIPGDVSTTTFRDTRGDGALVLEVPDLGPEAGQVVLMVDEAGALSWHFPQASDQTDAAADRGTGGSKRFYIPNRAAPAPAAQPGHRSLVGAVGRKLLKVIVYPLTDALVGATASRIAERWESRNRAYGLRGFSPNVYRQPGGDAVALAPSDMTRLRQGPALLFVHGTFSTAQGAFADIPPAVMNELHQRYGGRMFAFDHFSLSHDPAKNVETLVSQVRALGHRDLLEVDIVCHSRGGLVARTLALEHSLFKVRRIVFVGVPNRGTALAEPDHMVTMIDRLTTVLNLLPSGGLSDALDGILIAVKIIGHGALKGLDGLAAMNPNGAFLRRLNAPGTQSPEYFAIAANYEPTDPGLKALVSGGIDGIADRIFENAPNDLVVPEGGVYSANTSTGFPISGDRLLQIPAAAGVSHTTMFAHPEVANRLVAWLQ